MKDNKTIDIKFPILDGSISSVRAKCGNKSCGCQTNKEKWHGPYHRWTGIRGKKRTTVNLTLEQAKECERRIKRYRQLLAQIDQLIENAHANAPWKT